MSGNGEGTMHARITNFTKHSPEKETLPPFFAPDIIDPDKCPMLIRADVFAERKTKDILLKSLYS